MTCLCEMGMTVVIVATIGTEDRHGGCGGEWNWGGVAEPGDLSREGKDLGETSPEAVPKRGSDAARCSGSVIRAGELDLAVVVAVNVGTNGRCARAGCDLLTIWSWKYITAVGAGRT